MTGPRPRYVVANGIRIFCMEQGEGPLVLLCHGFPEAWYSWKEQMGPIAEAGFRAVAIDLPGYGRSDKPDVPYDVKYVSDCLAGVIEGLGHERAVLAGHDWGGLIAWPFARFYPERTAGVIGLNVADIPRYDIPPTELFAQLGERFSYILKFQPRYEMEEKAYADIDSFITFFFSVGAKRKGALTPEALAPYIEDFRPEGALTPPLEYYRNMDRNWELTEDVADMKVEVPCLMISAADDPVLPPGLADGMEERVPNVRKVVIEDCGHWTQLEQPEETSRHMVDYLKEVSRW